MSLLPTPGKPTRNPSMAQTQVVLYSAAVDTDHGTDAPYTIVVSNLRDPGSRADIRKSYRDGRAAVVREYLRGDPRSLAVIELVHLIAHSTIRVDKKAWVDIKLVDHKGIWIAPALVEEAADYLTSLAEPFTVYVDHRDLED